MATGISVSPFQPFGTSHAVVRSIAPSTAPESWLTEVRAEYARQESMSQHTRRLYKTLLPFSFFSGILAYGLFLLNDEKTRATKQFLQLLTLGRRLDGELHHMLSQGAERGGIVASPLPSAVEARLREIRTVLTAKKAPEVLEGLISELYGLGGMAGELNRVMKAGQGYLQAFKSLLTNRRGIVTLSGVPLISRLTGRSARTAKQFARSQPRAFVAQIFQQGLSDPSFTPERYQQIFQALEQANIRRAKQMCVIIILSLAGFFVTATDLKMKSLKAEPLTA